MKFNAEQSTITVTYNGTTDDLLSKIQAKSKDIIKDENILEIDQGILNIKLK